MGKSPLLREHVIRNKLGGKDKPIPANYLDLRRGSASANNEPSGARRHVLARTPNALRLSSQQRRSAPFIFSCICPPTWVLPSHFRELQHIKLRIVPKGQFQPTNPACSLEGSSFSLRYESEMCRQLPALLGPQRCLQHRWVSWCLGWAGGERPPSFLPLAPAALLPEPGCSPGLRNSRLYLEKRHQ